MFKKFMRGKTKREKPYDVQVQEYIKRNGINIIQKIYKGGFNVKMLTPEMVRDIFGEDIPKAPWISETNITKQCMCFLNHLGYDFETDICGNIYFKEDEIYKTIVQNHLKFSGSQIISALAECCETTNGRISYEQMQEILGMHYPKAPNMNRADVRIGIILFLKEAGLLFRFDDEYVYLP